jgi:Tol biopolymer transport system component
LWPAWSADGKWLYYTPNVDGEHFTIEKVAVNGGSRVVVRADSNSAPAAGRDALYFTAFAAPQSGSWDWEIRRASPEDGPPETVGRVAGGRVPFSPLYIQPTLSSDGQWLALSLADGATSNLWMLSTVDGSWRQVTDFGVPTLIVRHVSWSPDGHYLYAAVSKQNGDIVMFDGLV